MNPQQHLHLFTKVEDGLPNTSRWVLTAISVSGYFEIKFILYDKEKGFDKRFKVYAWLDLDKLTTKERAVEFAFDSIEFEQINGNEGYNFIDKNKNSL